MSGFSTRIFNPAKPTSRPSNKGPAVKRDDLIAGRTAHDEREACAAMVEKITMGEMLLAGGEMTAGERRTCKAMLKWVAHKIRTRKER